MRRHLIVATLAVLVVIVPLAAFAQEGGSTATAAGITFQTLAAKDLDMLKEKTGFRYGVLVKAVKAGTPAAVAGVKSNDLIFAVGESGVDCAEQAAAEITPLAGEITLTGATMKDNNYQGVVYKFQAGAPETQQVQPPAGGGAPAGPRAEFLGIVFESLKPADLDLIKEKTGVRYGVQIVEVKPGSAGAAAGLKATDLLLAVGKTGVDSAQAAVGALKAVNGQVNLGTCTLVNGTYAAQIRQITVPTGVGQAPAGGHQPGDNNEALVNKPTQDPIEAYFDMMDFIRSQAWGRQVSTSDEEKQRVAIQLQTVQLDQQSTAVLVQLPQAWAAVQNKWKGWNDAQKSKQRGEWYAQLLQPGGLYPPPASPQQFTAPQGLGVSFQYPGDWTGGWTEANGTPLLFIGPGGQAAQWEQVLDTPNSPPGALFALANITNDMKGMSYMQAAHWLAKLLIPQGLSSLKVIQELPIANVGAVITLTGKFPGQSEDRFYWVGVVKFGDNQIFAGRMGGTVKDAATLIPAFTYMLQTLQLNPPRAVASSSGGVSGAWDAAWSRVDVAITKNIWAPSGN